MSTNRTVMWRHVCNRNTFVNTDFNPRQNKTYANSGNSYWAIYQNDKSWMPINGLHAISQSQNTPLSGWRSVCFCKGPTKHLWGILHFTFNRQMSVFSSEIDCDVYDWNVNVKCAFFSVSPIQLNGKNDCLLFSINVRVPVVLTFFRKFPL